jgi:hypothetical protein
MRLDSQGTEVLENPIPFTSQKRKEITDFLKPGLALEIFNFLIPCSRISPRDKIHTSPVTAALIGH